MAWLTFEKLRVEVMRKNILSFMIASFVAVTVLSFFHIIKGSADGAAMAASGGEIRQGAKDTQKDLRKSVAYHPENLLQLAGQDVRSVLKEPDLVRQEFPTVIWQYRNRSCVLDVYFKSGSADVSGMPVVHITEQVDLTLSKGPEIALEAVQAPSC